MAKRICLLTGNETDCKYGCYNCDCGGETALNDCYVPIYNIQRVCDIVKGFTCTSTEGEEIAEYIRNELERMAVEKSDVQPVDDTENMATVSDAFICKKCGIYLKDYIKVVMDEDNDGYIDEQHYEYEPKFCPECGAKIRHTLSTGKR